MEENNTNSTQNEIFKPVGLEKPNYIKVIGIGGGGGNAVNHMMEEGIQGVDFVLCNTDYQALSRSSVKTTVHLGQRELGAGNDPNIGRQAAEMSQDEIMELFDENTKMVFVTAGMGGGTGTGATPVVAKLAKEKGILTVGIVTMPMEREGRRRKLQALEGIEELKKCVDTLILISTDKLRDQYGNMKLSEAFRKADDVLTTAAKGIAEIITVPGYVNVDFEDVTTVMKNSGRAIMGSGIAEGEDRAEKAIKAAIHSPLLNDSNIEGAKNILLYITSGAEEVSLDEVDDILDIAQSACGNNSDVIWGNGTDENLGNALCVTLIATGFEQEKNNKNTTQVAQAKPQATVSVGKKTVYSLDGKPIEKEASYTPAPEPTQLEPTATAEPEAKPQAETQDNIIRHSLFGEPEPEEKDEIIEEPIIDSPKPATSTPSMPSLDSEPVSKPHETHTVKRFDNPFRENRDDEGFEITSRFMSQQEMEAQAQETVVMEVQKKEVDPMAELKKQRLRALSMNFRTQRGLEELESQPAYMRRDMSIKETDDDISRYSSSQNGISTTNTFLHDNVD